MRDTLLSPESEESLAKGSPGGPRCVREKPKDGRQEAERRLSAVQLPVGDAARVGAEPVSDLALEQAEVEPAPAQVVADRAERGWIGCWARSLSS